MIKGRRTPDWGRLSSCEVRQQPRPKIRQAMEMNSLGETNLNSAASSKEYPILFARRLPAVWFLIAVMLLPSCRTSRHDVAQEYAPPDDIAEARRNVTASLNAVQSTLGTLDVLSKVSGPWPQTVVGRFMKDVERLQQDSFKLREHARAMHSRGDAYFEQWQLHLSQSQSPNVRKLAGEHHKALHRDFAEIQQASQRVNEAFTPFISELHALRRALENESAGNASDSTKELTRKAREEGHHVQLELDAIRQKLDAAASELARAEFDHVPI
jgi:hypothetical protein